MARKRQSIEPDPSRNPLAKTLRLFQQPTGQRRSLALDLLTGRSTEEDPLPAADPPAPPAPDLGVPARWVPPRVRFVRRTVYLSEQDLRDLDFIVRRWGKENQRPLSRSHVLRKAIETLRQTVEAQDSPSGEP